MVGFPATIMNLHFEQQIGSGIYKLSEIYTMDVYPHNFIINTAILVLILILILSKEVY